MENIRLPTPFKNFFVLLNQEQVKYLLVGGYAVNIYGYQRATDDMDIWIAETNQNSGKIAEAFRASGFDSMHQEPESVNYESALFHIVADSLRMEVVTLMSGLNFDVCFGERVEKVIDGVRINLISLERLLQNKKATGRLKDLADVEALGKLR